MNLELLNYPWRIETKKLEEEIDKLKTRMILLEECILELQNKQVQYKYTTTDSTQILINPANTIIKYSGGTGNGY